MDLLLTNVMTQPLEKKYLKCKELSRKGNAKAVENAKSEKIHKIVLPTPSGEIPTF